MIGTMGGKASQDETAATSGGATGVSSRTLSAKIENFLCTYAFTVSTLLLYTNANVLMFLWGGYEEFMHTKRPIMRWLIAIARGFGYTLNLNCGLVILLACRTLLTQMRDIKALNIIFPFDKAFPGFHKVVGFSIVLAVIGHAIFHFAWIIKFQGFRWGIWQTNMCVITGILLTMIMAGMSALGFESQRRKHFREIFAFHIWGATLFFPLLILHGQFRAKPYTWKWIVLPLLIYVGDRASRVLRTVRSQGCGADSFAIHDGDITGLTIPRHFEFKSGQYAELQIPDIDNTWHPFTIASAPHEDEMRFYIRAAGKWTGLLRHIAQDLCSGNGITSVDLNCRGPYGAPAQHVNNYKSVILISGGVGATPFCSVTLAAKYFCDKYPPLIPRKDVNLCSGVGMVSSQETFPLEKVTQSPEDFESTSESSDDCEAECENALRASISISQAAGALKHFPEELLLAEEDRGVTKLVEDSIRYDAETSAIEQAEKGQASSTMENWGSDATHRILKGKRYRFFQWLHSVRFNFFLTWVVLGRILLVLYGAAVGHSWVVDPGRAVLSNYYFDIFDFCAAVLVSFTITLAVSVELYYLGFHLYFRSYGRCVDMFCLIPISVLSTYAGATSLGTVMEVMNPNFSRTRALIHLIALLPALALLLAARTYRIIGTRVLLADAGHDAQFESMESMDFVWTTPTSHVDAWLVGEMVAIVGGPFVSLHRYVTREKPVVGTESCQSANGIETVFGQRPNFEEMFERAVHRVPSDSKVGVFFCGPPAMGKSIKRALMKVQTRSNFRGIYLHRQQRKMGNAGKLQAYGSFVRFVFREENF